MLRYLQLCLMEESFYDCQRTCMQPYQDNVTTIANGTTQRRTDGPATNR